MEKKSAISRNLLVIIVVIVLIAVVGVIAATQQRELNPTLGELSADATAAPVATEAPAEDESTGTPEVTETPEADDTPKEPANAYLVVTVAGAMYEPIPMYEEARYTITRGDMVNVIAVTEDSVCMHSSSCDNQDCVEQGTVTLKNRDGRVLQNMIICLPNEVVLELFTPEEVAQLLLGMVEYTEETGDE